MTREPVKGTPISLDELGQRGVTIVANQLSRIDEFRIGISLPNGGKIVILHSASGNPQDAGIFAGVEGEHEIVVVQDGGMQMWTPNADGEPEPTFYAAGGVVKIDPSEIHATHPEKGAWIVGIMTGNWKGAKKNDGDEAKRAVQAFDDAVDEALAEDSAIEGGEPS